MQNGKTMLFAKTIFYTDRRSPAELHSGLKQKLKGLKHLKLYFNPLTSGTFKMNCFNVVLK